MNIPKRFKLFGSTIDIVWDNEKMNYGKNYGESTYGQNLIFLATTQGIEPLPEDKIMDVFYHEKVHMILDYMKEYKLSCNEKFVDIFAKLLRQSDITAEYEDTGR